LPSRITKGGRAQPEVLIHSITVDYVRFPG
jgi:hypothetical protein